MNKFAIYLMVVLVTSVISMNVSADLTDGLVAHYPFNGNANDESGNGNDGTVVGSTPCPDRFGITDSAYCFDGVDDYISISGDIRPNAITITAWVNTISTKTGDQMAMSVIRCRRYGYGIYMNGDPNGGTLDDIGKVVSIAYLQKSLEDYYNYESPLTNYNDGNWHNIAITYDGETFKTYINGDLVYTDNQYGIRSLYYEYDSMAIGRDGNSNDDYFEGIIDDIRIYNHALSPCAIQCLYNGDLICSDSDDDGTPDACDNCPQIANTDQLDTYPPDGNGIGDACECEGDFNCDGNVDAIDVTTFLLHFGRNQFNNPCTIERPCNGDFNCDTNADAIDVPKFLEDFGRNQFNDPCPTCAFSEGRWCNPPAPVARTWQTICYDEFGAVIDCEGTGQDGEYQKGVEWPDPRFTDNGDETVTDNLTGLMWTKDTQQVPGEMIWSAALTACNNLDFATHTDWRLPNVREIQSLIDYGEYAPALHLGHPFWNVMSSFYWTSTTYHGFTNAAINTSITNGDNYITSIDKIDSSLYAWCMRGKTNGPVPVAQTGQSICYEYIDPDWVEGDCEGTGQDGDHQKGVASPNPRFTDNADGTVTDNLTGLIWLKDNNCFGQRAWDQALSDSNGLSSGSCGLTDGSSAGDWRLPNVREIYSLIDCGQHGPALPSGHPFTGLPSGDSYWSSNTYESHAPFAWLVTTAIFRVAKYYKSTPLHVWPVRGPE